MKKYLKNNKNIALLPGGFEEATIYEYNKNNVYINDRKGFIKYALRFGYTVVPVYTFGEEKTYKSINLYEKTRLLLNKLKIPAVFFYGKFLFLPYSDISMTTVIGEKINLPLIKEPKQNDIDKYHDLYKKKIKRII